MPMSEWSWVALGYGIAYAAILGYGVSLVRRRAVVRRQRAELP